MPGYPTIIPAGTRVLDTDYNDECYVIHMTATNGNVIYADEPDVPVAVQNEPGRFTILPDGARESNEVTSDTDA